ncbi:Os01g0660900 [Oryza sativa Japonica Group]|uniref:Os01g0660900 protein n=1 Tax=Oryza sativa subsp. japonica TaxID=39947 RepID=Q0JKN8_ORYSJ|nr:Os01g0660900 [Oryza sativa Japonica Group]|eukprot:NP_001043776.2 Os01g0660900 [Oryza sativa Japonica Group]
MQVQAASPATAASSPVAPSPPPPPRAALSPCPRRRELLLLSASLPLPLPLLAPAAASARGLFRMPPPRLANRYFLVRAGESVYEGQGVVRTNPVSKTSVDSGLSPAGLRQAARAALELQRLGACEDDCWIWPSITQRAYQAAEIIAAANEINRSHIVPEYSFLDARGLGAFEGKSLETLPEVYASDSISPDIKPPPISDGTPNESVADVFVRVTQLMSILETQYSGDTVVIVSPDSDNLSILQAGLIGLDLRRHSSLFFQPGEVRPVDPASIPEYKQPASTVFNSSYRPMGKGVHCGNPAHLVTLVS